MKDNRTRPPIDGLCVLFAVVTLYPAPASSPELAERIPAARGPVGLVLPAVPEGATDTARFDGQADLDSTSYQIERM